MLTSGFGGGGTEPDEPLIRQLSGRPLVCLTLAFIAGLLAQQYLQLPVAAAAIAAGALAAAGLALARVRGLALGISAFLIGTLTWGFPAREPASSVRRLVGRPVALTGTVASPPEYRQGRVKSLLWAERVTRLTLPGRPTRWQAASGLVELSAPQECRLAMGDRVELSATLSPPPEPANPGQSAAGRRGLTAVVRLKHPSQLKLIGRAGSCWWLTPIALRERMAQGLRRCMPRPYPTETADLLTGLVFGSESARLPPDLIADFRRSGTIHVLVVSGTQVSLILLLALLPTRRRRRNLPALALGTGLILAYSLMLSGSPPVTRAVIVGLIWIAGLALLQTRLAKNHPLQIDPYTTLALAALIILLADPQAILGGSFQLSFAAVLGIIYLAPHLRRPLAKLLGERLGPLPDGSPLPAVLERRLSGPANWCAWLAAATFSAQLAVAPVLWWRYHSLPVAGLAANLVVIPLAGLLTPPGLVCCLLAAVNQAAGHLLAVALSPLLWLMAQSAGWFGRLPGAVVPAVRPPLWVLAGCCLGLAAIPVAGRLVCRANWRLLLVAAGAVAALVIWQQALARMDRTLAVTFLAVGDGDAIIIQAPGGRTVLVDGGGSGQAGSQDQGELVVLPALMSQGVRRLEAVVATHCHQDHIGGLPSVLRELPVGMLLYSGMPGPWDQLTRAAGQARVPVRRIRAGARLDLGSGVVLTALAPDQRPFTGTDSDPNNDSVVLMLSYRRLRMLLAGDIEQPAEDRLLSRGWPLRAQVLKVAHQGSATSSSERMLERVHPRIAVISAGVSNSAGHPSSQVLDRLRRLGVTTYRTDLDGAVTLRSDGERLWTETFRRR